MKLTININGESCSMDGVKSVKKCVQDGNPSIAINFDYKGIDATYHAQYKTAKDRDFVYDNLVLED